MQYYGVHCIVLPQMDGEQIVSRHKIYFISRSRTVTVLLEHGADINPVDKTNTTPLHLASERGHVDVVKILLDRHARIDARDDRGHNCLDHAIEHAHKFV